MAKSLATKLIIPATFACEVCQEIAETAGLSQTPHGWRRRLDLAAFPNRCVTWRCGACVAADAAKGGAE